MIPKYNWDRLKKKDGCCKYRSFDPIMFTCGFCIFCVSFYSPLKLFRFAIFLIVIWPVWLVITTILFKKIKTFQENKGTSQWTMNEGARTYIFQCPLYCSTVVTLSPLSCDLLLSITMDDIAGYTLGTVWVEQYTVFSDVPYAVFKVSLSTLSNRYDRSWRKKPFGVLLHEKKITAVFAPIWLRFVPRTKPCFRVISFSQHVATTYAPWLEEQWNTVISCK